MHEPFVSPLDRPQRVDRQAHLGFGLLRPFRRDEKNDFANDGGVAKVKACVGQVLGTAGDTEFSQGELFWNSEFGASLYLLRHQSNRLALQELARHYVIEALRRWEPRVIVRQVNVERRASQDGGVNLLVISLHYDVIAANVPGNQVIVPNVEQTVEVPFGLAA